MKKFNWKLTYNNNEIEVKIDIRPTMTIEEVEINFLEKSCWIPGKASWETLSLTLSPENAAKLVNDNPKTLKLKLFDLQETLLEAWTINQVLELRLLPSLDTVEMKYDKVCYESLSSTSGI